ncbi:MAG: winged helix-turn-helix transcriptional regulator [Rhodospirillaceae bacterium]|jgi:DNA-binding MarR family transcriptional regulator|nr:winged helix-turn-helix transcriptional regulator [Rhodospirillaceae bacterium]MBT6137904.1 winged helix-turn-helix transcriptional regulator [Rhodospirillaceae bacterium]
MSETDDTNGSSDPAEKERELREFYGEMTRLIERLHRRYLEVVRIQLEALGIRDINSVQALILVTVADEEMLVRDLIQRCYYLGSSTNYNIKKLVDCEYLEQQRSSHDRRSVRIRLSNQGRELYTRLRELEARHAEEVAEDFRLAEGIDHVRKMLRRVERVWADYIDFG